MVLRIIIQIYTLTTEQTNIISTFFHIKVVYFICSSRCAAILIPFEFIIKFLIATIILPKSLFFTTWKCWYHVRVYIFSMHNWYSSSNALKWNYCPLLVTLLVTMEKRQNELWHCYWKPVVMVFDKPKLD